jgi:hypothetical protein
VTGVERLGNVGRGELDNHLLLVRARVGGVVETKVGVETVLGGVLEDRGKDEFGERVRLEEEADKGLFGDGREDEGGLGELQAESVAYKACRWMEWYLFLDLDGKSVRLLALDTQSRDGQHEIAVFQNLGPLQQRVDLLSRKTSDGSEQLGNVCAVDVDLVVCRECDQLGKLRDLVETKGLDRSSELLHGDAFVGGKMEVGEASRVRPEMVGSESER